MYPRGDVRYAGTFDEDIEDLNKVTLDEVRKFYQQFYGVSEGEFTVVGQFDKTAVLKQAEELIRQLEDVHEVCPHPQPISQGGAHQSEDRNSRQAKRHVLRRRASQDERRGCRLSGHDYGELHARRQSCGPPAKPHPQQRRLSYGVGSQFSVPIKDDGAEFMAYAISNPQNAPKVEVSMKDELAKTSKDGFTAEELAAAKKAWLQERVLGRSQDGSLAGLLASHERWGRTMQFDQDLDNKVSALTAEQVTAAFRRALDPAALIYIKAGDFKKVNAYQ
jgi:zinc protease